MTVSQLIALLVAAPPDAEVLIEYDGGDVAENAESVRTIEGDTDYIYVSTVKQS